MPGCNEDMREHAVHAAMHQHEHKSEIGSPTWAWGAAPGGRCLHAAAAAVAVPASPFRSPRTVGLLRGVLCAASTASIMAAAPSISNSVANAAAVSSVASPFAAAAASTALTFMTTPSTAAAASVDLTTATVGASGTTTRDAIIADFCAPSAPTAAKDRRPQARVEAQAVQVLPLKAQLPHELFRQAGCLM